MGTIGECGCSKEITIYEPVCFCPASGIARMIGRRYCLALLSTVGNVGCVRFGELKKRLGGISSSTLAARLEELEASQLVRREIYAEVPPRVEYSLTMAGEEFRERLKILLAKKPPRRSQGWPTP